MNFENVQKRVHQILIEVPKSRDSDSLLYAEYVSRHNPGLATVGLYKALTMYECFLPSYESVSRARRKIQSEYPELQATMSRREHRAKVEQEYREYYGM